MTSFIRRVVIAVGLIAMGQHAALAQEYPSRPVTMIVPWAAGGAVDTVARVVQPKLAERLGKPVVIENRPGGGSTIGTAAGVKAPPDGHTLGMPGSGSMAISPAMYKSLPYDSVKDIVPVALIGRVPFVLIVNPSVPVKTVPDLIAYAKTNRLNYGSGGAGSPHHLYAEMLKVDDRDRDDACALQRQRRCDQGCGRRSRADHVLRHGAVDPADPRRHRTTAWAIDQRSSGECAGNPATERARRAGFRCRGLVHDRGAARHAAADRRQTSCRVQDCLGTA